MSEFSAVQAGLNAFRARGRSFVLTGATFGYLLGSCLLGAVFIATAWPALSGLISWYGSVFQAAQNGSTPPDPSLDMFVAVAPWYGGYTLAMLLWMSVYEAACLRWMVRGETGGLLGLSFNGDTLRVFFTYLLWLVVLVVFFIAAAAFYGGLMAVNAAVPALRILMLVVGALAPLGILALLLWVTTRLSPAAAMSISRQRFAFFSAWGVTRGKFWDLLGAFFIIFAVYVAVSFAAQAVVRVPLMQAIYPVMTETTRAADFGAMMSKLGEAFTSPVVAVTLIGYAVLTLVLSCLVRLAWFGVNAYAVEARDGPAGPVAAPAPDVAPAAAQSPAAESVRAPVAAPVEAAPVEPGPQTDSALAAPEPEQAPQAEAAEALVQAPVETVQQETVASADPDVSTQPTAADEPPAEDNPAKDAPPSPSGSAP